MKKQFLYFAIGTLLLTPLWTEASSSDSSRKERDFDETLKKKTGWSESNRAKIIQKSTTYKKGEAWKSERSSKKNYDREKSEAESQGKLYKVKWGRALDADRISSATFIEMFYEEGNEEAKLARAREIASHMSPNAKLAIRFSDYVDHFRTLRSIPGLTLDLRIRDPKMSIFRKPA